MSGRLHCPPRPCSTCPYRRDTPTGIWDPREYVKLAHYDREPQSQKDLAVFHCHQENATGHQTVCVGWLGCHGTKSVAVRLALATAQLDLSDVDRAAATDVELYETGTEAALAGLSGVKNPSPAARLAIEKLIARRAGRACPEETQE